MVYGLFKTVADAEAVKLVVRPKYPSRPRKKEKQRRFCIVLANPRCYCPRKRMAMVSSRVMWRVLKVEKKKSNTRIFATAAQ